MFGTARRSSVLAIGASSNTRVRGSIASLAREKKSPGHGPRRAHADEPIACVATRHLIGQGGENPSAGRGPRMPEGDRTAIHVDAVPVHRIGGGALPALLPGRGVGQNLSGERFVDLDQINVLESQTDAVEQARYSNGGGHQQPLARTE